MKTMIWKELRENFKWAVLGFLVLLLAEIYVLSSFELSDNAALPLCSGTFLMTTAFGCSVIGAALAMVQILPELKRDQWAALLHRPVSRSVIFFGKVIAGLLLCLSATLLPLLASIWFVAAPRNFSAPFVPAAALPGLSDILLGVVFYFAAFLACLDRGRWFGVRGLLVLAAVPVFVLHISGANGYVVVPLAASLVLMLAAWGALLGNGSLRGMPRWGRAIYSLVALAGAETAFLLLAVSIHFLASMGSTQEMYNYSDFVMSPDGRLLFEGLVVGGTDDEVVDMDGKPFVQNPGETLYPLYPLYIPSGQGGTDGSPFLKKSPRNSDNYASWIRYSLEGPEYWYHLVRRNYLAGYDRLSRRYIGAFDRNGFEAPGVTLAPFAVPLTFGFNEWEDPMLAVSGSKVYSFNFAERTLKTFFDAGNGAVYGTARFYHGTGRTDWTVVALDSGLRIFDETGRQLMAVPYERDPRGWFYLGFGASKALNRLYVQFRNDTTDTAPSPMFADEYDLQGHLLHTYSRTIPPIRPAAPRWDDTLIAYTAPVALVAAIKAYSQNGPITAASGSWDGAPNTLFTGSLRILALIGLGLAAATFLWARRIGFSTPSALGWAIVSFLFGPAGVLTFRLATDWPVRVPCPACRGRRPIDAERCPHCGQGWLVPERNGTEILDIPGTPATSSP